MLSPLYLSGRLLIVRSAIFDFCTGRSTNYQEPQILQSVSRKRFNCPYLLFIFKGFYGFCFLSHSKLDILLKGALNNKIYKYFDYLFDFADNP